MGRRAFESPSLPPSQVSNHLITPLLSIIGELCRRRSELIKIIGKKDREIQDYKDQGITVSRRRQEVTCDWSQNQTLTQKEDYSM